MGNFADSLRLLGESIDGAVTSIGMLNPGTFPQGKLSEKDSSAYRALLTEYGDVRKCIESLVADVSKLQLFKQKISKDLLCVMDNIGLDADDLAVYDGTGKIRELDTIFDRLTSLDNDVDGVMAHINSSEDKDADATSSKYVTKEDYQQLLSRLSNLEITNTGLRVTIARLEENSKKHRNWVGAILGRRPEP